MKNGIYTSNPGFKNSVRSNKQNFFLNVNSFKKLSTAIKIKNYNWKIKTTIYIFNILIFYFNSFYFNIFTVKFEMKKMTKSNKNQKRKLENCKLYKLHF